MKFVVKHSLEHIALIKIVVTLWNQNDVRALIAKLSFKRGSRITDGKWKKIGERVTEKLAQFSLPQLLKQKALGFIKPIGLQIFEFVKFHCRYFSLHGNLPAELCWTPQGTIDRKKTAELLVKDECLDSSTQYKIACIYCMEDYILKFWNSMSEDLKESDCRSVISFWSYIMERRRSSNARISYKDEFQQCAIWGNKVAVEHFLQKLTPLERKESLVKAAKCVTDYEVLCFLLSEMDEEQQMEVFRNIPYEVLHCFLQWPFQSFFIGIANCMWDFLSKNIYQNTLKAIIHKVRGGYEDWNYQKLFREFWLKSPNALKTLITNEIDENWLLPHLFHIKDKEIIRLILKDATRTAKEKLFYSDEIIECCQDCICDNEWDFLEFVTREYLPSKNEMLKFKKAFEKCIRWTIVEDNLVRNKEKWDQLFCLSDHSICEYDKRSVEGECNSSKRFCSLK